MYQAASPTAMKASPSTKGGRSITCRACRNWSCESVPDRPACAVVHTFAQVFAWLEVRDVLARQRHGLARLRVSALARWPEMQREAAEAANLDALSGGEGI